MNINYLNEYPELKNIFEKMRAERRDEILDHLKNIDKAYSALIEKRKSLSMEIREKYRDNISEFDKYMDLVYEQEIYELDAIYTHAFYDAILVLKKLKL